MRIILLYVFILYSTFSVAEIVKWKDKDGKVHYSDKAPSGVKKEELKKIETQQTTRSNTNSSESLDQSNIPPSLRDSDPPAIPSGLVIKGSINDVDAVPYLNDKTRKSYLQFLNSNKPRIFAVCKDGGSKMTTGGKSVPISSLLNNFKGEVAPANPNCEIYAVNDEVVWKKSIEQIKKSNVKKLQG
jgi:Domain of unknown function (DUF4124)